MSARITPGSRKEIGAVNALVAKALGRMAGTGPPNVFTTLARNRRLFRRWLFFAGALMPGGKLPRIETELLILRVAHSCNCSYEWDHHVRLGATAGLSSEDIERVRRGPADPGWTERQAVLLRGADELHSDRVISDGTWSELSGYLDDRELIEFCLLVGNYEMLAMTLNSLGVEHDEVRPSRR
jgi:AhpD family alkylhydroperoxidase